MRIISGRFGGRDIGSVPGGVRPTSDRVRESLFSALGSVEGLRVLDLFTGTGALGLESVSRGAGRVVFVDRSRRVIRDLRGRFDLLGIEEEPDSVRILALDAKKAIERLEKEGKERFDLVFLDPPYEEGDRVGTLTALFSAGILSAQARVVVEGPKRHPLPALPGVRVLDERDYGDTKLTWLESSGPAEG
jgi:16S rRNA (guanine(966)-N(2))-methyltransferase RsmD